MGVSGFRQVVVLHSKVCTKISLGRPQSGFYEGRVSIKGGRFSMLDCIIFIYTSSKSVWNRFSVLVVVLSWNSFKGVIINYFRLITTKSFFKSLLVLVILQLFPHWPRMPSLLQKSVSGSLWHLILLQRYS